MTIAKIVIKKKIIGYVNEVKKTLTFRWNTAKSEWVSSIPGPASAYREMINNLTFGVLSTSSGTRILTLVPNTSFIVGTVCVKDTLRSAAFVRISNIFRQTHAGASTILFLTLSIGATR